MVTCGCGRSVPPNLSFCECGAWIDQFAVEADTPETIVTSNMPEPGVDPDPAPVPAWITAFELPRATITLPDGGRMDLAEGMPLELGRASPDPRVAAALAPLDSVSRHHAVLVLEGDRLRVTHVGRTNPTYANGQPAAPTLVVPLPAEVRLGQAVSITVTREA